MRADTLITVVLTIFLTVNIVEARRRRGGNSNNADNPEQAAKRAEMLKRIDTNGDGKMSEEEIIAAREKAAKERAASGKPERYRLETITFPKEVQDIDSNMNKEALFYQPIKPPEGKIPLIVLLHGAGGTRKHHVASFKENRDVRWTMTPANSKYLAKILVPHSRSHWNPESLNAAVDYLADTYEDIDKDRVYCCGYSLGGLGTWNWARHSPDRLAAIVPVAFKANLDDAEKMIDLPIWAMVGTADRSRAGTANAVKKRLVDELGSKVVRITIIEGANHGQSASKAWGQEGLMEWMFSHSLKNRKK